MLTKLLFLMVMTLFFVGCNFSAASQPSEVAKSLAGLKINWTSGSKTAIPLGNGLTIVNLFDEFATGCPTGNRFETLERFNSSLPTGTTLVLIFSDKHFSIQDVENFKAILPMAQSMVQGDIEPLRPQLIYGKLLIVIDSNGSLIWQEKPDMSEQQVFSEISNIIHSTGK